MPASESKPRRRQQARPREIVAAALVEFGEHGFAGARMSDIARRADAAKGTLYSYFPTKQALFEAVITERINGVRSDVDRMIMAQDGTAADILTMALRGLYQRISAGEVGVILRILVAEGRNFPELAGFFHKQIMQNVPKTLERIIQEGIRRGEFREGTYMEDYRVIIGPAIASAIWQNIFGENDQIDLDRYAAAHIDLVLNGLRHTRD